MVKLNTGLKIATWFQLMQTELLRTPFTELSERVNATMKTLRYDQISEVKGPKAACGAPVLGLPVERRSR
jgi:hypothetical protein